MTDQMLASRTTSGATCRTEADEEKSLDTLQRSNQSPGDVEKQTQGQHSNAEGDDPNLVDWTGPDDPENPQNWPRSKKWLMTMMLASVTFCVTFASSVFSAATRATSEKFQVSTEVMTLGTALFLLGFALGPLFFGPLSELFGRKIPLFTGFFIFAIFNIPVAVAQNVQTIMLGRFFGGVFGSAPLTITGGALADFWDPIDRGVAICIFSSANFVGPISGPIVGGFVTMSHLGWRWTCYITLIMSFFFGSIAVFIYPETYPPVILQQRAKRLRYQTKNWALHSKLDEQVVDLKSIFQRYLSRPCLMLIQEPILVLITIYMSLIYAVVYLFFEAYPISFQEIRGWNLGVGSLPLLAIGLGILIGAAITSYLTKTRFARKLKETGQVIPEERLIAMIIGGPLFAGGLFWFGWTSSPHISWVPQVLAGIPIGTGVLMIFLQGLTYIVDVYKMNANSAVAANTMVRSALGAGFPMFAAAMYRNLGVAWASSLLGFLATVMIPVPIVFYIYGAKIRSWSKYNPS